MQIPSVHTGQMSGGAINRQFFRNAGIAAAIGIGLPATLGAVSAVPSVGWLAARQALSAGAVRIVSIGTSSSTWSLYGGYQLYQDRGEIPAIIQGSDWGVRWELEVMPLPIVIVTGQHRVIPIPAPGPDLYLKTTSPEVIVSQSTPSSDHTAQPGHGLESSTPTIRGGGADNLIQQAAQSGQFFHWRKGRNLLD